MIKDTDVLDMAYMRGLNPDMPPAYGYTVTTYADECVIWSFSQDTIKREYRNLVEYIKWVALGDCDFDDFLEMVDGADCFYSDRSTDTIIIGEKSIFVTPVTYDGTYYGVLAELVEQGHIDIYDETR